MEKVFGALFQEETSNQKNNPIIIYTIVKKLFNNGGENWDLR